MGIDWARYIFVQMETFAFPVNMRSTALCFNFSPLYIYMYLNFIKKTMLRRSGTYGNLTILNVITIVKFEDKNTDNPLNNFS